MPKYFIDTEFIEGFHKPLFGKKRHFIDLISIGIVCEDGRTFSAISSEYDYKDSDPWVKQNVLLPLYSKTVNGDNRNRYDVHNFNKHYGLPNHLIKSKMALFFGCYETQLYWNAPVGIEVYAYYADYDWVLFCSLFGRMIDLPKGFPMYCRDLKQTFDDKIAPAEIRAIGYDAAVERLKKKTGYPVQKDEHNALADAKWNLDLYRFLQTF